MELFSRLKQSLSKTSRQISAVLSSFTGADNAFYDSLEETLILSDIGAGNAMTIVENLRQTVIREGLKGSDEIRQTLADILTDSLIQVDHALNINTKPSVILIIGVNGVGKTTTIGKLASMFTAGGKKVLLCAADTFRAAAGEQLSLWAKRSGADIVLRDEGADPASVVFDSISAAKSRSTDIIICDTAGRLHNKSNLMNELEKINRIINRELPDADKEVLLVLDATTGQNGLVQARSFKEVTDITGIVLTKLDGTAKGGIVFSIADELKLPVKYIGIGEKPEDLISFNAVEFSNAILA